MGTVYKAGTFLVKKRFLVLNPDDGTLIRYVTKEDYPLKPKWDLKLT